MDNKHDCCVCGTPLSYLDKTIEMECFLCKNLFSSNARCEKGHFVCDFCHGISANELIKKYTILSKVKDSTEIALTLMEDKRLVPIFSRRPKSWKD